MWSSGTVISLTFLSTTKAGYFLRMMVSKVNLTSWAVTGLPSCHFAVLVQLEGDRLAVRARRPALGEVAVGAGALVDAPVDRDEVAVDVARSARSPASRRRSSGSASSAPRAAGPSASRAPADPHERGPHERDRRRRPPVQRLLRGEPRRRRPGDRRRHRGRARPPAGRDRADRLGEHRLPRRAGGAGLGDDQQVRGGLSGPPLLRRLRLRRHRREPRHRARLPPVRLRASPTCSRTPAPRPTRPCSWR